MKCKIAQLEVLMKENSNTLIKGFNQLYTLMEKPLQDHLNQPYYPRIEKKHKKISNQSSTNYDHPKFPKTLTVDHSRKFLKYY